MTYKFFFSYTSLKEGVNTRKREPQQVASTKSRVMVDICHILPRHAGFQPALQWLRCPVPNPSIFERELRH